jgi:uncharacterized RDD family membrane protein YckC
MKCPACGFNTFDYIETCKKCGSPLKAKLRHMIIRAPFAEPAKQEEPTIDKQPIEGIRQIPVPTESQYELLFEEPSELKEEEEVLDFDLAGFITRGIAFLIDILILLGIATLTLASGLFFANANLDIRPTNFMNVIITIYLILLLVSSTYFVFLHGFGGRTIGKMIMGIRIIRDDGELIGLREAFIRWVGYFISLFCVFLGFIWAIFDSKYQTWHDKLAGTYVVME